MASLKFFLPNRTNHETSFTCAFLSFSFIHLQASNHRIRINILKKAKFLEVQWLVTFCCLSADVEEALYHAVPQSFRVSSIRIGHRNPFLKAE
jgi:hypothetical protein